MQRVILMLLCGMLLGGCAGKDSPEPTEHTDTAAMACAYSAELYVPNDSGELEKQTKMLPWEENMPEYVLSFVTQALNTSCTCKVEQGTATVDLSAFPVFETALHEQCAIAAIVNTLLAMPGIQQVALRFDGEKLVSLKQGMRVDEVFQNPITLEMNPQE